MCRTAQILTEGWGGSRRDISLWEISYFKCVRNFPLNAQFAVRNNLCRNLVTFSRLAQKLKLRVRKPFLVGFLCGQRLWTAPRLGASDGGWGVTDRGRGGGATAVGDYERDNGRRRGTLVPAACSTLQHMGVKTLGISCSIQICQAPAH